MAATGAMAANLPGGGDGTGGDVTIASNGTVVTMSNGIVTAKIKISSAQILTLTYHNLQVTDGGSAGNSAFYWQGSDQTGAEEVPANCAYALVADPSANGGNFGEISLLQTYAASGGGTNDLVDSDFHFSMFRGSPGIYVTEVITRPASAPGFPAGYPAGIANPYSFTCKLGADVFDWLAVDSLRNRLMPTTADWGNATFGINAAPKEVGRMTTGVFAGQFECKYNYSADLGSVTAWGWSSDRNNTGIWLIAPSHEYYTCGPMHRELLPQIELINNPFNAGHYGFHPDLTFAAGETWTKVCGPFLIYLNQVPDGTANPPAALWADAQAQAAAEQNAWPYAWFTNSNYVPAAGRGTVKGRIVINDSGNPNASPAGLWVGVAQTPPTTGANADFQLFGKNYQFWTRTDESGNFTIPNVIAGGGYNLYAFGPGAIGWLEQDGAVAVTAGETSNLGTVTWTPSGVAARVGQTVFEIGVPDRNSMEFLHGTDFWHGDIGNATAPAINWGQFQNYPTDFPNGGPQYIVGQSQWAADWDYVQPAVYNGTSGNYDGSTSTITFTLPQAPAANATASLYIAQAANYQGALIVTVNGVVNGGSTAYLLADSGNASNPLAISNTTPPSTGFFPNYSSSTAANDAMIRMGPHGIWAENRLVFPGSVLKQGTNTITLNMRKGGYVANSAVFDYIRLELTGYVPPAPGIPAVAAGASQTQLTWAPAPGAVDYIIQRAASPGGPFITIAANVTGPVAGSGGQATFTDTMVTNGLSYYYRVQSANPAGLSATSAVSAVAHPVQTFAQWIASTYPGQSDPQIVGPGAAPAADGLGNLLKYFFGLNPAAAQSVPGAVTVAPDGNGNLVMTFRLSKNLTGVIYQIQQSTDLANWTDTGLAGSVAQDMGTYYLMQASVPQGANPQLFLRLWVEM